MARENRELGDEAVTPTGHARREAESSSLSREIRSRIARRAVISYPTSSSSPRSPDRVSLPAVNSRFFIIRKMIGVTSNT